MYNLYHQESSLQAGVLETPNCTAGWGKTVLLDTDLLARDAKQEQVEGSRCHDDDDKHDYEYDDNDDIDDDIGDDDDGDDSSIPHCLQTLPVSSPSDHHIPYNHLL